MLRNRWLHAFFAATMAITVALAATSWSPWASVWPVYVTVAVLALAYGVVGHRGYEDPRAAAVFIPLMLLGTFVVVAVCPDTAFVQSIAFPLVWCQLRDVRSGVVASVGVGVAASLGFLVSLGPTADTAEQILVIEGISVVGACALGVWISRISQLSEERRTLIEELHATRESLAHAERTAGVAGERERIARDLHDTIAQDLAGIVMLAQRARQEPASAPERLSLIEDSARGALEESRVLVAAGNAGLASGSLGGALHRLAERFGRETGIAVTVDCGTAAASTSDSAVTDDVGRDAQVVLLRVAQEALANVRAHAGATAVRITLLPCSADGRQSDADAGRVGLRVEDDGCGFDASAPSAGFGLRGLRQRLALAGGSFAVVSTPGGGTTVTAMLAPVGSPSGSSSPEGPETDSPQTDSPSADSPQTDSPSADSPQADSPQAAAPTVRLPA